MPLRRLVVGVLALLAFAPPARASEVSLQLIGWSTDEQRFAVRSFTFEEDHPEVTEPSPLCPGYLDQTGKAFRGELRLLAYEKGKLVANHPIQDSDACTPPKKAQARLAKAKAEFAKLGIDLKQKNPGTRLTPDKERRVTVKEGPGAPYTLEGERQVEEHVVRSPPKKGAPAREPSEEEEEDEDVDGVLERQVKGALVVFVRQGGERRQLLSRKVEGSYYRMMGGFYEAWLAEVWLSPTGKTVVFISGSTTGNMRGASSSREVMGVQRWDGVPLVLR